MVTLVRELPINGRDIIGVNNFSIGHAKIEVNLRFTFSNLDLTTLVHAILFPPFKTDY